MADTWEDLTSPERIKRDLGPISAPGTPRCEALENRQRARLSRLLMALGPKTDPGSMIATVQSMDEDVREWKQLASNLEAELRAATLHAEYSQGETK